MSDHGSSAAELGIRDGPSGMPPHFDRLITQRDDSLGNFGRIGSFVDHGRGFAEATIAGVEHPGAASYNGRETQPLIGRSFWPHFTAGAGPVHDTDDAAGWTSDGSVGAIIKGRYKLTNQPRPGPRDGDGAPPWRLYDLEVDPGEITDLANTHPQIMDDLLREWESDWR